VIAPGDERLREEFAKVRNIAGTGESCPDTERIWDSAADRLPYDDNRKLIRHVASCGVCAASWRMARDLAGEEAAARPRDRSSRSWWVGLAAAAMIVLAAGLFALKQYRTEGPAEPVFRDWTESALASEIPAGTVLPREELVLRWSGAPDGTVYDLRVTNTRLQTLHRAFGLELPEYRVPAEALSGVQPGGVILWSVTAYLPDGRRWTSLTFRTTVE
jgi:hypothetical protein